MQLLVFAWKFGRFWAMGFQKPFIKMLWKQEFIENNLPFVREEELSVNYKREILKHKFRSDFMLFNDIIVEVKSGDEGIIDKTIPQILNYLRASGCRIGLIINFEKTGIKYKRLIV
jgi:GxxExxY protein